MSDELQNSPQNIKGVGPVRAELLRKVGDDAIVFGSDNRSGGVDNGRLVYESYRAIFQKNRVPQKSQAKIFYSNSMKFWGLKE